MCSKWQKSQITQNPHWNNFVKCVRFQDIDSFQLLKVLRKQRLSLLERHCFSVSGCQSRGPINKSGWAAGLASSFTVFHFSFGLPSLLCPRSASKSVRQNKDGIFNSLRGPLLTRTRYLFWCWKHQNHQGRSGLSSFLRENEAEGEEKEGPPADLGTPSFWFTTRRRNRKPRHQGRPSFYIYQKTHNALQGEALMHNFRLNYCKDLVVNNNLTQKYREQPQKSAVTPPGL